MRWLWIGFGSTSVAVGAVGLFLPFLPTVPFMILAAFCFARSSRKLHDWLMTHPTFGPPIRDWNERGAIGIRAKWFTTASIAFALAVSFAIGLSPQLIGLQTLLLAGVALFVWTRPSG